MKILFLEEKQSEIKLFESHLEDAFNSFESRTARTKKDFITNVKNFSPDVVIAGSTLSKYGISEALTYLKEQEQAIAFVFVTSDKDSVLTRTLLKKGADDFVLRSDLNHLHIIIHNAIKKKNAKRKKKQSEMMRKLNQEKPNATDNAPECIFQIGLKGELIEMNPAALEMTESPSEIELGKSKLWEFIDKNDIKKLKSYHQSIFKGNKKEFTFHFIGNKGTHHLIETRAIPLLDSDDSVTSVILLGKDITEKTSSSDSIKKNSGKETVSRKKK